MSATPCYEYVHRSGPRCAACGGSKEEHRQRVAQLVSERETALTELKRMRTERRERLRDVRDAAARIVLDARPPQLRDAALEAIAEKIMTMDVESVPAV